MYVKESGVGYTLYIQNNKYANEILEEREAHFNGKELPGKEYDSSLHDYLNEVIDHIPELKSAEESGIGIGVVILPESASSTLKDSITQTANKMLDEGVDETILKGVLGVVKCNYTVEVEQGAASVFARNWAFDYDKASVDNILKKFEAIYGHDAELKAGFQKFSSYLDEIYGHLQKISAETNDTDKIQQKIDEVKDAVTNELAQNGGAKTLQSYASTEEKKGMLFRTYS